jgi:hypothetical protein
MCASALVLDGPPGRDHTARTDPHSLRAVGGRWVMADVGAAYAPTPVIVRLSVLE